MKQIVLVPLFVLASSCGVSGGTAGDHESAETAPATMGGHVAPIPSTSYAEAHSAAAAAIRASAALGHAWSTADVLLKEGAVAAAGGDEALAIELTDRARIQAELSISQAEHEERAWSERVLSN